MRKLFCCSLLFSLLMVPLGHAQDSTGYSYDILGVGGLFSHSPTMPDADWTFVGPQFDPEVEYDVIAVDADSAGTVYGVDLNTNLVGTIDPATAEFTTVSELNGDAPPFIVAMTIDETDTAWVSDGTGLWTMDLATGTCINIATQFTDTASLTAVATVFSLATDGAGNYWAFDVTTDTLWSMDETSGDLTSVGVFPTLLGDANFSNNSMDWDPVSGSLIADVYTGGGTGSYGVWDVTTGGFTEIANHTAFVGYETHGGGIACFGETTFQVDFWGDLFATYNTLTPTDGSLVLLNQPAEALVFAMDFDDTGETLYGIDVNTFELGTISTIDGAFAPLFDLSGDLVGTPVGMTCDASDGQFYVATPFELYTLDVDSGLTTLVGGFTGAGGSAAPGLVIEIASNSAGEMFVFSSADDSLFSVDKTNAETTLVGVAPVDAGNFIQGMDFDPVTNELYGAIFIDAGTGLYGTWDTTTGVFTTIIELENLPPDGDGYELKLAFQAPLCVADVEVVNGELVIGGTPLPNDILVEETSDGLLVTYDECEIPITETVTKIVITAGDGRDDIEVISSIETFISGGRGFDTIVGGSGINEIRGGPGRDVITGGDDVDTISGGLAADIILGMGGDDVISANEGADEVHGGPGNDTILGGIGIDTLNGDGGNDTIRGGDGLDTINGGAGNDFLFGNRGLDQLFGNGGDDEFTGGEGNDFFDGGAGNDTGLDAGEAGEVSIENSGS